MPRVLIDTTVLFAASYRRDSSHATALSVLHGIDEGSLPEVVVLDYVLAETLNGLTTHVSHDAAVDLLDRLEENGRVHLDSLTADARATGKAIFRRYEPLSFVDSCIVAYMQSHDFGYLYAFDEDFDIVADVARLETALNPFDPT